MLYGGRSILTTLQSQKSIRWYSILVDLWRQWIRRHRYRRHKSAKIEYLSHRPIQKIVRIKFIFGQPIGSISLQRQTMHIYWAQIKFLTKPNLIWIMMQMIAEHCKCFIEDLYEEEQRTLRTPCQNTQLKQNKFQIEKYSPRSSFD